MGLPGRLLNCLLTLNHIYFTWINTFFRFSLSFYHTFMQVEWQLLIHHQPAEQTLLKICSQATKFMTELHAIFHKIESTLCNKVTINATFTSLMSSMPSHSLCYAKLVQHRFNTSLILNFSEKMFSFCNVNLNNFKSFKYQNKFWRNIWVENNKN